MANATSLNYVLNIEKKIVLFCIDCYSGGATALTCFTVFSNQFQGKLDTKGFFGVAADDFPDCLYSIAKKAFPFTSLCRDVPVDYGYSSK